MMKQQTIKVNKEDAGNRLDKTLSKLLVDVSRSQVSMYIESGNIKVNNQISKASYSVKENDLITIEEVAPKELSVEAQDLGLNIIYQDEFVAIVDKPKGMVVHPAIGSEDQTLVNGLLYEMEDLSGINGVIRPGIVHRIDKDTSGLLMVAKNDIAHVKLSEQLKEHTVNRIYVALVYGEISAKQGRIEAPIGRDKTDRKMMAVVADGKHAVTNFKVLKNYKEFTLIECKLETGRTHQIRVHMKYIGHPIVGDKVYGPRRVIGEDGQMLHAKTIGFIHPNTNEYMEFNSELPESFNKMLNEIEEKEKNN